MWPTSAKTTQKESRLVAVPMPSRDFSLIRGLIVGIALFAALALFFTAKAGGAESENIKIAKALSSAYAEVMEKVGPAVVGIDTERFGKRKDPDDDAGIFDNELFERFFRQMPREFGPRFRQSPPERRVRGIGSGVIIDREGHILTNNHVIADADRIKVELADRADKNKTFEAEVIGADPNSDLAVIKLKDPPPNLPVAVLGDSETLKPGNIVIAIGSPMGFKQSVTTGVVSATGRTLGEISYEHFIQTDAAINPGNSGGPLVNLDGEVVGLNTMISTRSGGSDGIGFAIPISQAKNVAAQLIEKGSVTRGWLGIVMNPDDPEISLALGHDGTGVLVTDIDPEGPSAKAGVRKGDLIVSFDNIPIQDNDHLRYLVADTAPGRNVPLTIIRSGEKVGLTIAIQPQPQDLFTRGLSGGGSGSDRGDGEAQESNDRLGIDVKNIDSHARETFNLGDDVKSGVVVTKVDPAGPAADKGIQPGTVILEMNNRPVTDVTAFRKILDDNKGRDKILVYLKRGDVARYVMLSLK